MICLRNKQLKLKLRRLKTFFTNRKTHQKKSIERLKGIKTETKKHLGVGTAVAMNNEEEPRI